VTTTLTIEDRLARAQARLRDLQTRRERLEEELQWSVDRRNDLRSWCAEVDEVVADSQAARPATESRLMPNRQA
jgi:chromosome segregation ATPase